MTQRENKPQPSTPPRKGQKTFKTKARINVDEGLMKALETRFSLSASEARAYTAILVMGQLTPYEIGIYSDMPMPEIEPVLKSLLNKNLIKVMPGIVSRYRAFAPYKDLADVVSEFYTYTTTSLDELRTIQKEVKDEISSKFRATSFRIETNLGNWSEQQSTTINDVVAATKTMLDKVVSNLLKAVTSVSDSSCNGLSIQTATLQQNIDQTINDGIKQIKIKLTESLEKAHKTIEAHQVASEQWLAAATNRILQQLDTITNQLEVLVKDANSTIQQTIEKVTDSTTTDLSDHIEGTRLQAQKTTTTITKGLETLGEAQQKAIDDIQKQHDQTIAKTAQEVNQRFRQSWIQRLQGLDHVYTDIDKTLRKESQRLKQAIDRSAADIHTTIETTSQTATHITDRIRQNLGNAINESHQAYLNFQRETEAAIVKWPPTALEFAQLARMKENLVNLTQQASNQYEKLLRSINKTLNIDMKGAQQEHLGEMWTLFEQLGQDLTSQQSTLTTNVEAMVNELGKTLTTRLTSIQKATTSLLQNLQRNVQTQEKETNNLKEKAQTLITQQGASLIDAFGVVSSKINQFTQERSEQTREAVEELGITSLAKTSGKWQVFEKHLNLLENAISKKVDKSIQSLLQNLDQVQGVVRQYADGVETTSDKLREEQKWQLETAMKAYRTIVENQQKKRDKAISRVFRSTINKLSKNHRNLFDTLEKFIQEQISQHTSSALENYRAKIKEQQPVSDERAIRSFKTTLRNLIRNQLLSNLNNIIEKELQALKDNIVKAEEKIVETVHQTDSYAWLQAQKKWTPIVEADEQFTSTLLGNLTALNIAINTSLDQASQTIQTTLKTLQEETVKILTTTSQNLSRDTTALNKQVTQGITEMKEGCLDYLGEMRGLLDSLGQDLTSQQSTLTTNVEAMVNELGKTLTTRLTSIQKATASFLQNLKSEAKLQKEEGREFVENTQTFIKEQSIGVTDVLGVVAGQLHQFSQEQIEQAQKSLDELWDTNKSKIAEYREEYQTQIDSFRETITKESDEYISTLQRKLTQLQEQTKELAKKIGVTNKTTTNELTRQIDVILSNYTAIIEEQQTNLEKETSSVYQSTSEMFEKTRSALIAKLSQDTEEAHQALEKELSRVSTKLEEIVRQADARSEARRDEQKTVLTKTIADSIAMVTKRLNGVQTTIGTTLNQTAQTITTSLANIRDEVGIVFTTTKQSLDSEAEKLKSGLEQEANKSLQTYNQELELAKSRLSRSTQDVISRTSETMNNVNKTASTDIQQQGDTILSGIKQFAITVEEQLVTETKQTRNRLGRSLGTKRRSLMKESQILVKEITKTFTRTEETSLAALSSFAEKTEPTLKRIITNAGEAKDILMGLWNSLIGIQVSEAERTWHIVTHERVQTHLKDMIHRAKDTITLVYPSLDKVPIEELIQVKTDKRIHLVTTVDDEKHKTMIQRLLRQGNVRIWHSSLMEFYAGARDNEEILIAPIHGDPKEIVAVVSDQESYVALFNNNLGPRWISASREIR